MPKVPKVNLDALIQREDMESKPDLEVKGSARTLDLTISNLSEKSLILPVLRKPDFQRETSDWEPEQVCGLIETLVNEELIPSIILWAAKGTSTFIIDGSHRVSAMLAWIYDDYGDGDFSVPFFDTISSQQKRYADRTRKLVEQTVGKYGRLVKALKDKGTFSDREIEIAKGLYGYGIPVQWCVEKEPKKAEKAFFRINREAVYIDDTELQLIDSRSKPNAMAARAIISGGTGYDHWRKLQPDNKEEIRRLAGEIHEIFFEPKISGPISTLDLPIAGKLNQAYTLPLVVDFVHMVNGIDIFQVRQEQKKTSKKDETAHILQQIPDDTTGEATVNYLKNCLRIARLMCSKDPSSLGLHPYVYFYSRTGKYKIASFYAVVSLILNLEKEENQTKRAFMTFTNTRFRFEEFLLKKSILIEQIVRRSRSSAKGYTSLATFFNTVLSLIRSGTHANQIVSKLRESDEFSFLQLSEPKQHTISRGFSRSTKAYAVLSRLESKMDRCQVCKGYLSLKAFHHGHIIAKSDGGTGLSANDQLEHPYCDSSKPKTSIK